MGVTVLCFDNSSDAGATVAPLERGRQINSSGVLLRHSCSFFFHGAGAFFRWNMELRQIEKKQDSQSGVLESRNDLGE